MKKSLLTTFFLLICFIAMSKSKSFDYTDTDNIFITFLNSPNWQTEIDTTMYVYKNKPRTWNYRYVKFEGFYNCLAETELWPRSDRKEILKLEINTNSREVAEHYYDVITKGIGISKAKVEFIPYEWCGGEYYISILIHREEELVNPTLYSAYNASKIARTNEIAEAVRRRDSIAVARRDSLRAVRDSLRAVREREIKKAYDRNYNMQKELHTLKREYVKSNKIKEKYITKLNSTAEILKYCENTLNRYDKLRLQEVDELEKQYIGRLMGEVFIRKKEELNNKWKLKCNVIENKAKEAESSLVRYRQQCIEDFNNYILAKGYEWEFGYTVQIYDDWRVIEKVYDFCIVRDDYYNRDDKQLMMALLDTEEKFIGKFIGFVELCRLGK